MARLFACAMPIAESGDESIRQEMLPLLCSGGLIGANAITEQDAGSDVSRLATTAERVGDRYVITGENTFVSNGPMADVFLVYATSQPGHGYLGLSAFVVDRGTSGLVVGKPF